MTIDHDDTPVYTQEFFEDCLRRGGWKPVALEEDLYLMNYQGKHGAFIIYGKFMPSQFLVGFSGVYPYSIPDEKMPAILEYIHYTNCGVPFGNLELKESTNEVCFRTGLLFFEIELTGQLINNLVNACAKAIDRYMVGIPLIIERNMSIKEAHKIATS
jgi:hypothetical protein